MTLLMAIIFIEAAAGSASEDTPYTLTLLQPQELGEAYTYSYPIRFADTNGDGRTDVILSSNKQGPNFEQNLTSIALAGEDGRFTLGPPQTDARSWVNFSSLQAGDINGDGRADLVWYDYVTDVNNVRVALSQEEEGTLSFQETQQLGTAGWDAYPFPRIGDVHGDGRADLIWNARHQKPDFPNNVFVGAGQEDGTITLGPLQVAGTKGWARYSLTTADVNGDGRSDVIWSTVCAYHDFYNEVGGCALSPDNYTALGLGQEDGNFNFYNPQNLGAQVGAETGWDQYRLITGDLTGDGRDELIFNSRGAGFNYLYVGSVADNGAISMQPAISVPGSNWFEFAWLTPADLDGDGDQELVWNSTCQGYDFNNDPPCAGNQNLIRIGSYMKATNELIMDPEMDLGEVDGTTPAWRLYTRAYDFNGDGIQDLIWNLSEPQRTVMVALGGEEEESSYYLPLTIR
jgi:hypothetical protein